jgi:thymidylate kinase
MFIIIEGIDKSGKSTVAELYREQGYEVVHMSAPDKKYQESGYSGPSYLDDLIDIYLNYNGRDVVFDRSPYGEAVWPHVYGREPLLSEDDIEVLQEFEDRNQTERILMVDLNTTAHWQRCVDNNEPLTNQQFRIANSMYTKLANKYNFVQKQLSEFNVNKTKTKDTQLTDNIDSEIHKNGSIDKMGKAITDNITPISTINKSSIQKDSGLERLEKANAISTILSKRLVKQRGESFDELEREITLFLKGRLDELLGGSKAQIPSLSESEIQVLKMLAQRFTEKAATPVQKDKQQRR